MPLDLKLEGASAKLSVPACATVNLNDTLDVLPSDPLDGLVQFGLRLTAWTQPVLPVVKTTPLLKPTDAAPSVKVVTPRPVPTSQVAVGSKAVIPLPTIVETMSEADGVAASVIAALE